MKNRFIDLLIEKNRKLEKKALSDSLSLYSDEDPTKYNPWNDLPFEDGKKEQYLVLDVCQPYE